jgi:hypothetical protein
MPEKKTVDIAKIMFEIAKIYGVEVKGKSFIEIYKGVTDQLPREAVEEALRITGHRHEGVMGSINEVLRNRLVELDEKEKSPNVTSISDSLLTLREARLNNKLTLKEVSAKTGISVRTLTRMELDCSRSKLDNILILLKLYGVSADHVFFGKESDCLKRNNENKRIKIAASAPTPAAVLNK